MVTSHLMLDYSSHLVKQNGWTALARASFNDHHEVVECLLTAGANPDLKDEVRMGVYPVKQGDILRASDSQPYYTKRVRGHPSLFFNFMFVIILICSFLTSC